MLADYVDSSRSTDEEVWGTVIEVLEGSGDCGVAGVLGSGVDLGEGGAGFEVGHFCV